MLGLLSAVVVYAAERLGMLEKPELQGYDVLVAKQHAQEPPAEILYVDFDEDTVEQYNAFPIPRALLGDLLQKISSGKPAVIGLDVILDKPRVQADDKRLASIIADGGNVIVVDEYGFLSFPPREPLPNFADAAAAVALADVPMDADGAARSMVLVINTPGFHRLSFPVAVASYYSDLKLHQDKQGNIFFGDARIPPANTAASAWIHFSPSAPVRAISVKTVLADGFDASIFSGKIVMVGQTSELGKDLFVTPVTQAGVQIHEQGSSAPRDKLSGTEVHAAAVATLLKAQFIRRLSATPLWATGAALAFLVIALAFRTHWYVALTMYLALAGAIFAIALYMFGHHQLWIPFVSLEACILLALPAGLGYRSVQERHEKKLMEAERSQIMGLFERYVSADVAAEIWKRRDEIVLAGEERVATVLFSDIRGFTAMTAGVPSKEVLAWLNRYLTVMAEVIKENRGFLNKFIGDGIMVVFGAPLTAGAQEDARRATRCAVEMLARMDRWNASLPPGQPPMKIGIGIHSGTVTAGNVGSPDRLEYSVIGETVNLASRLEALTKDFKTPIVLSPATYEYIQNDFATVSLGKAQVRGFSSAIPLYGLQLDGTQHETAVRSDQELTK
ncbi:MAG TPA: adenylate/guanylate cyclase domain-containing protein [Candidatus Dormibacteraeota bacterium]|nr:adenylate/guanylate cyclase domain-containing protein [Candidatus Dormibacteraeota bacterium]